jgi:hypothetical protein
LVWLWFWLPFFLAAGAAYAQDEASPLFVQLSQGEWRLHLSFRCLQGAHERGTRFRLRTTLKLLSGEWPEWEEVVEGGVGVMLAFASCGKVGRADVYAEYLDEQCVHAESRSRRSDYL